MAAGAEKMPLIEKYESTSAVYNDPVLTQHLAATLEGVLGKGTVVTEEPIMTSEDYSYFVEQGVPSFYFTLGVADPQKLAEAKSAGGSCPATTRRCLRQCRNLQSKPALRLKLRSCAIC